MGEGHGTPGGVFDRGVHAEDGPVTWEALSTPLESTGKTESRLTGISDGSAAADARVSRLRISIRRRGRSKARGTGAETEGGQGVGGLHKSEDAGERMAPGAGRAKAARAGTNAVRETWTGQRIRGTSQRDSQG